MDGFGAKVWMRLFCGSSSTVLTGPRSYLERRRQRRVFLEKQCDEKGGVRGRKKGKLVSYLQWKEFPARARENKQMKGTHTSPNASCNLEGLFLPQ